MFGEVEKMEDVEMEKKVAKSYLIKSLLRINSLNFHVVIIIQLL
jgi:hypothetical protein